MPNRTISTVGPTSERAAGPFRQAASAEKRLKLFAWGGSGVGKTTLALQFPKPVLIDLEGGADLYGKRFDFSVVRASTADQVASAVEWLATNPHEFETLVIDPISVYWDALQKKWSDIFLLRNKGTRAHKHEFYEFQPRDWMTMKAEFKHLIRGLVALDMNVIVTARQKVLYADGGFMKAIGETFDCEKSLPYLFDVVVRLYCDEKGRYLGQCLKDRSGHVPTGEFEPAYEKFQRWFGLAESTNTASPETGNREQNREEV